MAVFVTFRFFCVGVDTGSDCLLKSDAGRSTVVGVLTTEGVGGMSGGGMLGGSMASFRFRGDRLGFDKVKVDAEGLMFFIG